MPPSERRTPEEESRAASSNAGPTTSDAAEEEPVGGRRGGATARREARGDDDDSVRDARERLRYELLLGEYRLPYPVHVIAPWATARGGEDILVTTRRSFHVLRSGSVPDGDIAIDESVALLEENLSKLLSM